MCKLPYSYYSIVLNSIVILYDYMLYTYIVIAEGDLEQCHPSTRVRTVQCILYSWKSFVEEVEGL